ncbi:MAG: bacillithiol biosynthesis protein BshC, partial [Flavobacteriales bacterium]
TILGNNDAEKKWIDILTKAYSKSTVADSTRDLVYAIFGTDELIVIDADDATLKSVFAPIMKQELSTGQSHLSVSIASTQLEKLGYSLQVSPREINLFLLENQQRTRILPEQVNEQLMERLERQPQDFSPNVVLRPVYQECILPNIAYIGGPGELAYWLQLKGVFDQWNVPFPALVLRDSALLITNSLCKKIEKLQLDWSDLFRDKQIIINHWLSAHGEVDTMAEKKELDHIFQSLTEKAVALDPTLAGFVAAEYTRQLSALEGVEKKMKKALKSKEDQRIQQLEKILSECFPEGQPQERVVNAAQFAGQWPEDFIEKLITSFDPLALQMKVICF